MSHHTSLLRAMYPPARPTNAPPTYTVLYILPTSPEPLQEKSANANINTNSKVASDDTGPKQKGTKRPHSPDTEESTPKPKSRKKKQDASASKEPAPSSDLNDVHLEGEEEGEVPVFDTCDDIRKKITSHLQGPPKTSQAAFAVELSKFLPGAEGVSARQMGTFMRKKGPCEGASSPVFYAGYVFFEKRRVQEGTKKSKKRGDMEKAWEAEGGMPHGKGEGSENQRLTVHKGEGWRYDRFGVIQISGR